MARANNLILLASARSTAAPIRWLRVTATNPRRSSGFNAAVNGAIIASKDATSAIAGGSGRFSDISNENWPFVRSKRSQRFVKAPGRAARCT